LLNVIKHILSGGVVFHKEHKFQYFKEFFKQKDILSERLISLIIKIKNRRMQLWKTSH